MSDAGRWYLQSYRYHFSWAVCVLVVHVCNDNESLFTVINRPARTILHTRKSRFLTRLPSLWQSRPLLMWRRCCPWPDASGLDVEAARGMKARCQHRARHQPRMSFAYDCATSAVELIKPVFTAHPGFHLLRPLAHRGDRPCPPKYPTPLGPDARRPRVQLILARARPRVPAD